MARMFHNSFIVDVAVDQDGAVLTDSQRLRFYVDAKNATAMSTFKHWLQNVFMKGAYHTPTIIEYSIEDGEGAAEMHVVKICTVQ